MSKKARGFIGAKVRILKREGYSTKQAVAIAYAYARRHGYKVSRRLRRRR